jgi:hypothetical protein
LRKKREKEGVRVERRKRGISYQKPRERKELKNEIFCPNNQINILSMRNYHFAPALNVFKTTLILSL